MEALSNIEAILIRASVSTGMTSAHLRDVFMDAATQTPTGQPRAYEVEQCVCPAEYEGLSCEVSINSFANVQIYSNLLIIFIKF